MIEGILISTNEQSLKPVAIGNTDKSVFAEEMKKRIHSSDYLGVHLWQESAMIFLAHDRVLTPDKTKNTDPPLIFHGAAILTGFDKELKQTVSINYAANIEQLLYYINFSIRKQRIHTKDKLMLTCIVNKQADKPFIVA